MQPNLDRLGGLIHSQRVLLALTQKGVSREDAYRSVQRSAMKVWRGEGDFLTLLKGDPDVAKALPAKELEDLSTSAITSSTSIRSSTGCSARIDGRASANIHSPRVLVFDSGVGGLTVFREIARARPDARFVYAADDALLSLWRSRRADAGRPRRRADGDADRRRTPRSRGDRLQHRLDAGAAARCARASRCRSSAPCRRSSRPARPRRRKRVSVLGTEATVAREYTHALIRNFGAGLRRHAGRLGAARGARRSGARAASRSTMRRSRAEIAPCFVDGRPRAPTPSCSPARIFRCCSTGFERLAPWPVRWIDPAPAIARRVVELVGPAEPATMRRRRRAFFTSGRAPSRGTGRSAGSDFGLRPAVRRVARDLTPPRFPPRNRAPRGLWPARRFATRGPCLHALAQDLSVPGNPGQQEGAFPRHQLIQQLRTR